MGQTQAKPHNPPKKKPQEILEELVQKVEQSENQRDRLKALVEMRKINKKLIARLTSVG